MLLHTLISIYIYNYAFYYFWLTRSTRVKYYLLIEITYLWSPYACELSTAAFCVAAPPYALSARSSRRYPVCTHVAYLARSAAANSNLVYLSLSTDGRSSRSSLYPYAQKLNPAVRESTCVHVHPGACLLVSSLTNGKERNGLKRNN